MLRDIRRAAPSWLSALGLAIACGASEPNFEPCASGENNRLDASGECVCLGGYERCDPDDPDNLSCCISNPDTTTGPDEPMPCASGDNNKLNDYGECVCQLGYEWCNLDDLNDLNCCLDSAETSTTG